MCAPLKTIYKIIFKPFPYFVLAEGYKITGFTICLKRLFPASFRIFLKLSYTSPDTNVATNALYTFLWYNRSIQLFASVLILDYQHICKACLKTLQTVLEQKQIQGKYVSSFHQIILIKTYLKCFTQQRRLSLSCSFQDFIKRSKFSNSNRLAVLCLGHILTRSSCESRLCQDFYPQISNTLAYHFSSVPWLCSACSLS